MPQAVWYVRSAKLRKKIEDTPETWNRVLGAIEKDCLAFAFDKGLLKAMNEDLLVHDWVMPFRSSPAGAAVLCRISFTLKKDGKYVDWSKASDVKFLETFAQELAQRIADYFFPLGEVVGIWPEGLPCARYAETSRKDVNPA